MQLLASLLLLVLGVVASTTGDSVNTSPVLRKIHELFDSSLKIKQIVDSSGACVGRSEKSTEGRSTTSFNEACSEAKASATEMTSSLTWKQKLWIKRLGRRVRPIASGRLRKKRVTRKEIRQYSDSEWKDVVAALKMMKTTEIDGLSQFAILANLHEYDGHPPYDSSLYGVVGPGSWGWHREYLARFEKAMQSHVSGVSLPYWDVSLDAYIPLSSSVIWSDVLLGNCGSSSSGSGMSRRSRSRAAVTTGPFSKWLVEKPCTQEVEASEPYITRSCKAIPQSTSYGGPLRYLGIANSFNDAELKHALDYSAFADFATDTCLLEDHEVLYLSIGGTSALKAVKSCTAADPAMIFMHVYLDYIWEQFRQKSQTTGLEKEYMSNDDGELACHGLDEIMEPFGGLKNSDGLDNLYTKHHYVYEESVDSCTSAASCGSSSYLWCDTETSRCKSKIRTGESCKFFSDEACESGVCGENHICTSSSTVSEEESSKEVSDLTEISKIAKLQTKAKDPLHDYEIFGE